MGIQTSLDAVLQAESIVEAIRRADDLAFDANRDPGARTIRVLMSAIAGDDQLVAIAATHALSQVFDEQADVHLSRLLTGSRAYLREHAAWALATRLPRLDAVAPLIGMVADGDFAGMLAQRTLEEWSEAAGDHIAIGLQGALIGVTEPDRRYRLVETLGLIRGKIARRPLLAIVRNRNEDEVVRVAAVSALGQRRDDAEIAELMQELTEVGGYLSAAARLALIDLGAQTMVQSSPDDELTVAQLFLHADIDADLSQVGRGDNGGIATLLVRLGDALVRDENSLVPGVGRVLTLSRGTVSDAIDSVSDVASSASGHVYGRIPLLSDPVPGAAAWPLRVAARRGIRRMLRAARTVDLLHLRMADVGSLAAADVARELEIPVVFTVAPDPHAVISSMDLSGRLTRENFGEIDGHEHFWFRAKLVQQLAANAAHTVLFPRPELERDMKQLVGIDITQHSERHTIVPEGIDLTVVDLAVEEAREHAAGAAATPAIDELRTLLADLPAERRGLPLVVSVGRFHRVKGMATIVDAWANSPLSAQANLLLIGGDLQSPSIDEQEQLDLMNVVVPPAERAARGLILSGHRRNDTVARWVAATRFGVPGLASARGIYVCGSVKEEFGIALLEAMGTGLLLVAPNGGGPATYVEPDVTGFLTTTWSVAALGDSMQTALQASLAETSDERAIRSRTTVEQSFTVQAMARALVSVYDGVHREELEVQEALVTVS